MTDSKPPRSAAWLLQHLFPAAMREALAGDLAEEFARRGSAWYWRQVIFAIVAVFFRHLRNEWTSIGFALVWLFGSEYLIANSHRWLFAWEPNGWWIPLPWPWSMVFEVARGIAFGLLPLVLGLALYLLGARRLSLSGNTA